MGMNHDVIKDVLIHINVMLFFPVWELMAMKETKWEHSDLSKEEIEIKLANGPDILIALEVVMVCLTLCGVWILVLVYG